VIVPAARIRNLLPLASMLIGHNTEVVALLDGDEPARKEGGKLYNKLLAKTLFIGDFTNIGLTHLAKLFYISYVIL
jgi:hypothetical protein